jgi:hypothetical protein
VKPLAALAVAKALAGPQENAPPPRSKAGGKASPETTKRRRPWLRASAPLPARFLLGRRPTA